MGAAYRFNRDYPENLLQDIFGDEYDPAILGIKDLEASIDYAVGKLSDAQQHIIRWCYKYGKTIQEALDVYPRTIANGSTVRQHAIRQLRKEGYREFLLNGMAAIIEKEADRKSQQIVDEYLNPKIDEPWYILLMKDVYGVSYNEETPAPEDLEEQVAQMVDTLEEREAKIVYLHYEDGLNYREIGDILGVTGARISSIMQKVFRKLNHPARRIHVSNNRQTRYDELKAQYDKLKKEHDRLISYNETLQDDNNALVQRLAAFGVEVTQKSQFEPSDLTEIMGILIEDLDLSVRPYNALIRYLRDKKKIGHVIVKNIVELFQNDEILKVRNLGKRSCEEVYRKLVQIGVPVSMLNSDTEIKYTLGDTPHERIINNEIERLLEIARVKAEKDIKKMRDQMIKEQIESKVKDESRKMREEMEAEYLARFADAKRRLKRTVSAEDFFAPKLIPFLRQALEHISDYDEILGVIFLAENTIESAGENPNYTSYVTKVDRHQYIHDIVSVSMDGRGRVGMVRYLSEDPPHHNIGEFEVRDLNLPSSVKLFIYRNIPKPWNIYTLSRCIQNGEMLRAATSYMEREFSDSEWGKTHPLRIDGFEAPQQLVLAIYKALEERGFVFPR